MHFLYPSDPFRTKRPDEIYGEELAVVRATGFGASVFSLEAFQAGLFVAWPPVPPDTIIYRGWMLSPSDYEALTAAITRSGARVLTDTTAWW